MGAMSRTKGSRGEREIAGILHGLTGWTVKRRVRQHDGDSDLEGIPGWSVEVKRHATATRADIAGWWDQAVAQAGDLRPVLFYRRDRDEWRAVWCELPTMDYQWTAEASVAAWVALVRL